MSQPADPKLSPFSVYPDKTNKYIQILYAGRIIGQRLVDTTETVEERLLLERTRVTLWDRYYHSHTPFWICITRPVSSLEVIPVISLLKPVLRPGHRVFSIIPVNGEEN